MTPHTMAALMNGMLILMGPAFVVCTVVAIMAYRRNREERNRNEDG